MIEIHEDARGYIGSVLRNLERAGWTIVSCPDDKRLRRNGQKIVLRAKGFDVRFRLFAYKITGSGRDKPYERRIEITSTYQKGLQQEPAFPDVVLGCDPETNVFVGVDARRIGSGGPTGNASSFFDEDGLRFASGEQIHIRQRAARLFRSGIEFHAFMKSERLAEYLFNREDIHRGTYGGDGPYSAPVTLRPDGDLVSPSAHGDQIEMSAPTRAARGAPPKPDELASKYEKHGTSALRGAKVTPGQFADIRRRLEEIGRLGEEFVVAYERKRLKRASRPDLASKVRWVSQISVAEGFDILSFEVSGVKRHIEVKASIANRVSPFEMSTNEWKVAVAKREKYWLYLVRTVLTKPRVTMLPNPVALAATGAIEKTASGWRVTVMEYI